MAQPHIHNSNKDLEIITEKLLKDGEWLLEIHQTLKKASNIPACALWLGLITSCDPSLNLNLKTAKATQTLKVAGIQTSTLRPSHKQLITTR